MAQVLHGVRVVEHGTFITGPAASMLLADLGADVIKVELPGTGDSFRAFKGGLYSPHYQTYNRNKRSVTLDTRVPADRERFDELIRAADVYIRASGPASPSRSAPARSGCASSIRNSFTPRSAVSARPVRPRTGPPMTRWPRPPAASLACWSTRPIPRCWGLRWPIRSPVSTPPTASWVRCTSGTPPASVARWKSRCSRR